MALSGTTLEKIVGLAGGLAGMAFGGEKAIGLAIDTGKLIKGVHESNDPESSVVLGRLRQRVRADYYSWIAREVGWIERADLEAADQLLANDLAASFANRGELAKLATAPDGFVAAATAMVVAEVAARHGIFATGGERQEASPTARSYLFTIVGAALNAAVDDKAFFARLQPHLLLVLGEAIGRIDNKLDLLVARAEAGFCRDEVHALQHFQTAVLQLAQLANDRADNPDAALAELRAMLRTVLDQRAASRHGSNLGGWLDAMIRQVVTANSAGRFNDGAKIIASAWQDRQRQRAERAEAERAADLQMCDFAIGQQRLLPGGAATAAEWLQRKVEIETRTCPAPAIALNAVCQEWENRGRDFGGSFDLEVAIILSRSVLRRLASSRQTKPQELGYWQHQLSTALLSLGEHQINSSTLLDAITNYSEALKFHTHESLPLQWARTKNGLGAALFRLGERQSDGVAFSNAAANFIDALKVFTFDNTPLDWAMAKNNLGNVLSAVGIRQRDGGMLQGAIAAYTDAIKVYTFDVFPIDWAMTKNNLGVAFAVLGQRPDDQSGLYLAVSAFKDALRVRTFDKLPLKWAESKDSLGIALRLLGERDSDSAKLHEAVNAFTDALAVNTIDKLPLAWAKTRDNMAYAHMALARLEHDTTQAEAAVAMLLEALTALADPSQARIRTNVERGLARAEALLAELRGG